MNPNLKKPEEEEDKIAALFEEIQKLKKENLQNKVILCLLTGAVIGNALF